MPGIGPRRHRAPALSFDLLQGLIDRVDLDDDPGRGGLRGARREAAIDRARLRRYLRLLVDGSGQHERVVVFLHRLDPPIERRAVERSGPIRVVHGDLEVHDLVHLGLLPPLSRGRSPILGRDANPGKTGRPCRSLARPSHPTATVSREHCANGRHGRWPIGLLGDRERTLNMAWLPPPDRALRAQNGYSSLRQLRGSSGCGFGVRSSSMLKKGATNGSGAITV